MITARTKRDFLDDRINKMLAELKEKIIIDSQELEFLYKECGYKSGNAVPKIDKTWRAFGKKEHWGGKIDSHAWFYGEIAVPKDWKGGRIELSITTGKEGNWDATNPQFIAYVDGKMVQGLDTNHTILVLDGKKTYKIHLYAYAGMLEAELKFMAKLQHIDVEAEKLYYHVKVPSEAISTMDSFSKEHIDIMRHLNDAVNFVDFREPHSKEYKASIAAAIEYLDKEFYGKYCAKANEVTAVCIGHTHIDVAWLWTIAQTREKVLRSFSTVLNLMKQYPEYKFMSSQAQLYKYAKEESPELYEAIKKMVEAGRWEVEGAMWVEADCNLASGESLVRQLLLGKRFFKDEFGVDCRVLWLPDVFGYSAAMPQILRKSGVNRFVTSKISWNETNAMPDDLFMWRGIDGTEILSYFLTAQQKGFSQFKLPPTIWTNYNANTLPQMMEGTWDRFQNKDLSREVLVTFGHGDGGGGPTAEMLEYTQRQANGIAGVPAVKLDTAGNFLNRIEKKVKNNPRLPKWVGELYLELHRGTYTTIAKNKRNNRKCEFLYQNTELLSAMDMILNGGEYPQTALNDGWETILVNQFHDIIPGSSIKEVYEDSDVQYAEITDAANIICGEKYKNIAKNINTEGGLAVFNPHSFVNSGVVDFDGKKIYVENIPAKGYKVVSGAAATSTVKIGENTLENKFFKVKFDADFNIISIYDKKNKREVVMHGKKANVIQAFEDIPRDWDAWEISDYFEEKMWEVNDVISVNPIDEGARAGFAVKRKFVNSVIEQKIFLYNDVPRIDFDTNIDWKESHIMLKAAFPVDVNTDKATYDIQFGTVERSAHYNTSWDKAQFEVCAHKFADLSDGGYGVSLMNDCKYGYDIKNGVMRLSLLRSPTWPNPDADKCEHNFTYSLYPHASDHRTANTMQAAYDLNMPMTALQVGKQNGIMPEEYSFVSVDKSNLFVETVKKAEDSDSLILRIFEAHNAKTSAEITFGFDVAEVWICDMQENRLKQLKVKGISVKVDVNPFEIVTLEVAR